MKLSILLASAVLLLGIESDASAQGLRARRQANNDSNTTRQGNSTSPRAARNAAPITNNVPQQNFNTRNTFAAPNTMNNAASGGQIVRSSNGTQVFVPATQTRGVTPAQPQLAAPMFSNGPAVAPQFAEPVAGFDNRVSNVGAQPQSVMKVSPGTSGGVGPANALPARGLEENVIPFQGAPLTIENPAATRGPVKFTINGEPVTLPAGQDITFDNKPVYIIEFTRGGGQGNTRYTLAAGANYSFSVSKAGWELRSAPADSVAPPAPKAPPGASLLPPINAAPR